MIMNAEYDGGPLDGEGAEEEADSVVESEAVTRDRELYAELLRLDFSGPRFGMWVGQMRTYAVRVLTGWLRSGEITEQCARRRIRITIHSVELEIFARNAEVRSTLAIEAVMAAGPEFTERALRGDDWDPDKGACIFTYFVGACLFAFRDVFKKWSRDRLRRINVLTMELTDTEPEDGQLFLWHSAFGDPARRSADRDTIRRILAEATPEAAAICLLKYEEPDLTYKQIGERLGGMTSRAVEGQLQRLRGTAHRMAREGKVDYAGAWGAGR
ncbi:hypothetical protein ACWDCB_44110 [Streptomyces sp. NPDC001178]